MDYGLRGIETSRTDTQKPSGKTSIYSVLELIVYLFS